MRRGFSVSNKNPSPFKGLGVLVGEGKPNTPSTASERRELSCLYQREDSESGE